MKLSQKDRKVAVCSIGGGKMGSVDENGESSVALLGVTGAEALSTLFTYELDFLYDKPAEQSPFLDELLGQEVRFRLGTPERCRYVCGIVTEIEVTGRNTQEGDVFRYSAIVRPKVYAKKLNSKYRCFNSPDGVTAKGILAAMMSPDEYDWMSEGTGIAWTQVVQYGESDFDFMSRILERDGLCYYFDQTGKLIVCGANNQLLASEDDECIDLEKYEGKRGKNHRLRRVWRPEKHRNYDFEFRNQTDQINKSGTAGDHETAVYADYCRHFKRPVLAGDGAYSDWPTTLDDAVGSESYNWRFGFDASHAHHGLGKKQVDAKWLEWQKHDLLATGVRVDVAQDYPWSKTTFIRREKGKEVGSEVTVQCQPFSLPFKTNPIHSRPTCERTETATVVGAESEGVDVDEFGRVKIQPHWHQTEYSTDVDSDHLWARVAHTRAMKRNGSFWLPRVGEEVVITYVNGNPSEPLIVGSVYNVKQENRPYLPDRRKQDKTLCSDGGSIIDPCNPAIKGLTVVNEDFDSAFESFILLKVKESEVTINERQLDLFAAKPATLGGKITGGGEVNIHAGREIDLSLRPPENGDGVEDVDCSTVLRWPEEKVKGNWTGEVALSTCGTNVELRSENIDMDIIDRDCWNEIGKEFSTEHADEWASKVYSTTSPDGRVDENVATAMGGAYLAGLIYDNATAINKGRRQAFRFAGKFLMNSEDSGTVFSMDTDDVKFTSSTFEVKASDGIVHQTLMTKSTHNPLSIEHSAPAHVHSSGIAIMSAVEVAKNVISKVAVSGNASYVRKSPEGPDYGMVGSCVDLILQGAGLLDLINVGPSVFTMEGTSVGIYPGWEKFPLVGPVPLFMPKGTLNVLPGTLIETTLNVERTSLMTNEGTGKKNKAALKADKLLLKETVAKLAAEEAALSKDLKAAQKVEQTLKQEYDAMVVNKKYTIEDCVAAKSKHTAALEESEALQTKLTAAVAAHQAALETH